MEPISLASLLPPDFDATQCKLHCAVYNGESFPIDVLGSDMDEWQRWNSWRNVNDDFNRRFIFSLAQDRHDPALWLFGGIWEVVGRRPDPRQHSYDVLLRTDLMGPFIRRLYVRLTLAGRNRRRNMEACLPDMSVALVTEAPFAGKPFPGHDRIDHSLEEIQAIVGEARADWRIALEHMKGVYVIHDSVTGEPYVGSAYGDTGIWQRWSHYALTFHGGNVGLKAHLAATGEDYFRKNMRFALLEFWSMRTDDQHVIERETYWKKVLLSRSLGHNLN